MTPVSSGSSRRLGLLLWLAGIPGILAVTLLLLPAMLAGSAPPLPLWAISLLSFLQSAVLLAVAVWAGVGLAPRLGLRAPAFEALAASGPVLPALRGQLLPGLIGGMVGAGLLILLTHAAPAELTAAQAGDGAPLAVRVFYGGITEELLLRWGVMSILLWACWRIIGRSRGQPSTGLAAVAIIGSAILFGAGHLPAAAALAGTLSIPVTVFIIAGNAAFGIVAGFLFWRHGLESAMLAHLLAHVLAYLTGS